MTRVYRGDDCELFGVGTFNNAPRGAFNVSYVQPITLERITTSARGVRQIAEVYAQIRRNYISAIWGTSSMLGRRFAYDSREWSRLAAWEHLTAQHIPGAPMIAPNICRVPWRKSHNEARHEWAWIYVG